VNGYQLADPTVERIITKNAANIQLFSFGAF